MTSVKVKLVDTGGTRIYGSRWYVLTMVCIATVLNNLFWASWGPISQSTELVYDWTDSTLFWVANVGNISAFLFTLLGCYLIDRKGIRVATVVCMAFMTVTATSRVITTNQPVATIFVDTTSIAMALPPAVAEVWFHVTERTTATAISAFSTALGAAAAFLFGPLLVSMPAMNGLNILLNQTDVARIQRQMSTYNYINFGVTAVVFLCVLFYLPGKPPTAPSLSAQTLRYPFWNGVKRLTRIPSMWVLGVSFGVILGVNGTFLSMLNVILGPKGISQTQAGWISFYACLGSIVLGLITSRFVDKFKHKMKSIILVNYSLSAALLLWFSFMSQGIIPSTTGGLYVAVIFSCTLIVSTTPLFFEITCEISYPIGEGVTAGFLGVGNNLGAVTMLAFSQIEVLGASWMSWGVFGMLIASLPMLAALKVRYQKVDLDTGQVPETNCECDAECSTSTRINHTTVRYAK